MLTQTLGLSTVIKPVIQVDKKINPNGIHVPNRLANISKLRLISMATTKKSITMTKVMNIEAV